MDLQTAVSVIIPVYNGEAYLRKCLDSVFGQTLKNIQVICVDDGSTDSSGNILREYRQDHPNMEIITQKNGGLSVARNAGLVCACGEYVDFIDCDDTLQLDALERLYHRATQDDLDMLFYDGETIYDSPDLQRAFPNYENLYRTRIRIGKETLKGEQLFVQLVDSANYRASACMYLVRLAFLRETGIAFLPGIYYEDNVFTLQCLLSAQRTGIDPTPYYKRSLHEGSTVTVRKDIRHARSYYICQNAIQSFVMRQNLCPQTIRCVLQQVQALTRNAANAYMALSNEERRQAREQYPDVLLMEETLGVSFTISGSEKTASQKEQKDVGSLFNRAKMKALSERAYDSDAPFVSVIIPMYNAAGYLEETIEDLQKQRLNNFEMIFVDDGSTDDSCRILERFMPQDPRIRLLHQENHFAGVARNTGMAEAKGEYLLFLDADDRFDQNLLAHAYCCAAENQADIVVFHADLLKMPERTLTPATYLCPCERLPKKAFSGEEGKTHIFDVLNPWIRLYKREYIRQLGVQYQPLFSCNDVFFSMVAGACAKRIAPLPEVLVHYRTGQSSNIQSNKSKSPLDVYNAFSGVKKELIQRGLFDAFRRPFAVKAAESMLRSLDTLTTIDSYRQLYQVLHDGGMLYLEIDCLSNDDLSHISNGAAKLARCREIMVTDFDAYCLRKLTEQSRQALSFGRPGEEKKEIAFLRNELNAVRSSFSFRIGQCLTWLPRKLRGGVRCYRGHGMRYTLERLLAHLRLRKS